MQDNFFFALRQLPETNPSVLSALASHANSFFNLIDARFDETNNHLLIQGSTATFHTKRPSQEYSVPYEYAEMDYESFKGLFLVVDVKVRNQVPLYFVTSPGEINKILEYINKVNNDTKIVVHTSTGILQLESPVQNHVGEIVTQRVFTPQIVTLGVSKPNNEIAECFLNNEAAIAQMENFKGFPMDPEYPVYVSTHRAPPAMDLKVTASSNATHAAGDVEPTPAPMAH